MELCSHLDIFKKLEHKSKDENLKMEISGDTIKLSHSSTDKTALAWVVIQNRLLLVQAEAFPNVYDETHRGSLNPTSTDAIFKCTQKKANTISSPELFKSI